MIRASLCELFFSLKIVFMHVRTGSQCLGVRGCSKNKKDSKAKTVR